MVRNTKNEIKPVPLPRDAFNPLKTGDPKTGNWQTVQTQIRRHRTRRLIRVPLFANSSTIFV